MIKKFFQLRYFSVLVLMFLWVGVNSLVAAGTSQIGAQLIINNATTTPSATPSVPVYSSGLIYERENNVSDENPDDEQAEPVVTVTEININNQSVYIEGVVTGEKVAISTDQENTVSGHIDSPEAVIFIKIINGATITGTTQADKNGNWSWQLPVDIPVGSIKIFIGASSDGGDIKIENYYALTVEVNKKIIDAVIPDTEVVEQERIEIKVADIKKIEPIEIRDLKESIKIYTDFNINNKENIVEKGEKLLFSFKMDSVKADGIPDEVTFRLRDWLGNIISEKTLPLDPMAGYEIKDYFDIDGKMKYGGYYLESLFVANNHTILDRLYFRIADKKVLPFIGQLNLDSAKNIYLFYTIFSCLLILTMFSVWQFLIFAKYNGGRIQGRDLKDNIKKLK